MLFISLCLILGIVGAQEITWEGPSVNPGNGRLKISQNNRYLVFENGMPFFYLGDTAWELFHRLSKTETEKYLENRREKGFTVIQAVILAELDGLKVPNAEGNLPLFDSDPSKPNEKYFEHVDWVIKKAAEKGLFIGLLPTWGDKVDKQWGAGPQIFDKNNAFAYGQFLGERYKNYSNIIWINGGDRSGGGDNFAVWDALAKGIKSKDPNHLMTFHPWGEQSASAWFRHCEWLDFSMVQTGHNQRSYAIYKRLLIPDYETIPEKPVIDGEPRYEDHPVAWNPGLFGWFDDTDTRQAMYWSLFSGSFGHTYGNHAIWQMLAPGRQPVGNARNSWEKNMDMPGAWQLIHARRLLESRPFTERIPYQTIIQTGYFPETDYVVATRGKNYVFVYFPTGSDAEINLLRCGWARVKAWWYNPRDGEATGIGIFQGKDIRKFSPPTKGRGNDWILVLDNAKIDFPPPGER